MLWREQQWGRPGTQRGLGDPYPHLALRTPLVISAALGRRPRGQDMVLSEAKAEGEG
jgi:hypothetical protein